ncbi:MAG TPA: type II toxin-antitoxin system HicA family toxin [Candidatus Sulfopaludibacter sp.]|nr:type II toxin-antitoxin system HicA family toxin [Candidatus Sulfopaludibacter sp.]
MPPLPVLSGAEVVAIPAKAGYRKVRQKGSHVRLLAAGRPPVTVPLHQTLDRGTLRAIIRAADLSVEEFLDLLN